MTTKSQTRALKAAFERFVELIGAIDEVQYVVAYEPKLPDIFTYITCMDPEVMRRVYTMERKLDEEFPDLSIDFHIKFLDGRPVESFYGPLPELSFARDAMKHRERQSGVER